MITEKQMSGHSDDLSEIIGDLNNSIVYIMPRIYMQNVREQR